MKIWKTFFFLSLAKKILDPDLHQLESGIQIRIKTFWIRHTGFFCKCDLPAFMYWFRYEDGLIVIAFTLAHF